MSIKSITWIVFGLMVVAQLYVPMHMIWQREAVLRTGQAMKFECAPIDPNDPFRGKYVALNFVQDKVNVPKGEEWSAGQPIFIELLTDARGMVSYGDVATTEADAKQPYLKTTVSHTIVGDVSGVDVYLDLPFDRFYMEETKAQPAEDIYREHVRSESAKKPAYASVYVLDGRAVLHDLFIDNQSINDLLD